MEIRTDAAWRPRASLAVEMIDEPLDLDVLAGHCLAEDADPRYADLPCYVPLIDEDEERDPFSDLAEQV